MKWKPNRDCFKIDFGFKHKIFLCFIFLFFYFLCFLIIIVNFKTVFELFSNFT